MKQNKVKEQNTSGKNWKTHVLAFFLCCVSLPLTAHGFSDVNANDWYYSQVTSMTSAGYLQGKSTDYFGANDSLSVAEFAVMISNAFYGKTLATYMDNVVSNWYDPYLLACYNRGGMSNTQAGAYFQGNQSWGNYPHQGMNRYDMASMITSLLKERGVASLSAEMEALVLAEITDDVMAYYKTDVATAYYYQFISGYEDGGFYGSETMNRAQAAVVLASLVRSPLIAEENLSSYYSGNTDSNTGTTDTSGLHSYVVEVFRLVNEERAEYGLTPYVLDTTLCTLAQYKSDEMSNLNYLEHTSPTYGAFSNILTNNGINAVRARENLARGQRSPSEVVTAWMNSLDHRTNILATDVGKIGIGFTDDGYYWSQLFTDMNANTNGELTGDLGSSNGSGGTTSGDNKNAMEIPFYQYDNYLEVGYDPEEYLIHVPINNIGDYTLTFTELYLYGENSNSFLAYIGSATIPVGGSSSVILQPVANLPAGTYNCTVEFAVADLPSLQQSIVIYVSQPIVVPDIPEIQPEGDPVPDFVIPEISPETDPEPSLGENVYTLHFYGTPAEETTYTLTASEQNAVYYEETGETKVKFTLSPSLPQGVSLDKVTLSHFGATVKEARFELNRNELYVTFQNLSYSGQMVDMEVHLKEGYRVVLSATPIGVTLLINGEAVSAGQYSPFLVEVGDYVELLVSEINSSEYAPVVKDSSGNRLTADLSSSFGSRSSGIYVIEDGDLHFSIGSK